MYAIQLFILLFWPQNMSQTVNIWQHQIFVNTVSKLVFLGHWLFPLMVWLPLVYSLSTGLGSPAKESYSSYLQEKRSYLQNEPYISDKCSKAYCAWVRIRSIMCALLFYSQLGDALMGLFPHSCWKRLLYLHRHTNKHTHMHAHVKVYIYAYEYLYICI